MDIAIWSTQELIDILEDDNKDIQGIGSSSLLHDTHSQKSCGKVAVPAGALERSRPSSVLPAVVNVKSENQEKTMESEGDRNEDQSFDYALDELRRVLGNSTPQSVNDQNCADIKNMATFTKKPRNAAVETETESVSQWLNDHKTPRSLLNFSDCSNFDVDHDRRQLSYDNINKTTVHEKKYIKNKNTLSSKVSIDFHNDTPKETNLGEPLRFSNNKDMNTHNSKLGSLVKPTTSNITTSKQNLIGSNTGKSLVPELISNKCSESYSKTITLAGQDKEENVPDRSNKSKCDHCSQYFENQKDLIQHLYQSIKFGKCNSVVTGTGSKKKIKAELFQCNICTFYVNNAVSLKAHMMIFHKQTLTNPVSVNFDKECRFCSLLNDNHEKHNHHIRTSHSKLFFQKKSQSMSHEASFYQNHSKNDRFIPRSILFKCCECNIMFFSCTEALCHSRFCAKTPKNTWKCNECSYLFEVVDQNCHLAQHIYGGSFDVYVARKKLLQIILCQCPQCGVYFNETNIQQHCKTGCRNKVNVFRCRECDILIHSDVKELHEGKHKINKLSRHSFILVDFILTTQPLKDGENHKKNIMTAKAKRKSSATSDFATPYKNSKFDTLKLSFKLNYCTVCQTYLEVTNNLKNEHLNSNCKEIPYESCDVCGIVVTQNDFLVHIEIHKKYKDLKLLNFHFVCLQDKHKISPPIPKYCHCSNCGVHFFNQCTLVKHKCHQTKYTTCEICKIKFDDFAYQSHLAFHEYSIVSRLPTNCQCSIDDDGLKILYICDTCDMAVDLYDTAIDHAQNHYTKTPKVQINHCSICDIKFESHCYSRHIGLHERLKNLTKESFTFLRYSFTSLISKDWLKMFAEIPQHTSQEILLATIYKDARHVKMNVIQDGPTELTLYKCAECSNYIDPKLVSHHTQNGDTCTKIPHRFICKVCNVSFFSKLTRDQHQRIHDLPNINESLFRIITFNIKNDRELDKLIKQGPKCNEGNHSNVPKINNKNMNEVPNIRMESKSNNVSKILTQQNEKKYRYYKCSSCDVCVQHLRSARGHFCVSESNKMICPECDLCFASQHFSRHVSLHEDKHSKLQTKITYFSPAKKTCNEVPMTKKALNDRTDILHSNATKKHIVKIFKCAVCRLHFSTFVEFGKHVCSSKNKHIRRKCFHCKHVFDKNSFDDHLSDHNEGNNKFKVVEVKQRPYDTTVYRCSNCLVLFPTAKILMEHFKINCPLKGVECKICDNVFHPSMFISHISKHAETGNKTLDNIQILTINKNASNKSTIKTKTCQSEKFK